MTLKKHINIVFDQIKINHDLSFFELWKEVDKIVNFPNSFDLNHPTIHKRIIKNFYLSKYFIYSNDLEGDVMECGVFKGFSGYLMRSLQEKINENNISNEFFLIDSFEGLSDIQDEDKVTIENFHQHKKGHFKVSLESVDSIFKKFNNVNILKGWIPEILNSLDENNKYKFVHLDVDLYQPTLESLKYIFDKVINGGIILTDDFSSPYFPGNKKAWQEFFLSKNIKNYTILPTGQSVYIKES